VDARTGELLRELPEAGGRALAVAPGSKLIATGSLNQKIKLWDLSGNEVRTLTNALATTCLAFSPDGKTLAGGSWDQNVRLWNVASGELLAEHKAHQTQVWNLAFTPDSNQLITVGGDHAMKLWDWRQWREIPKFRGNPTGIFALDISSDREWVIVGSGSQLRLWRLAASTAANQSWRSAYARGYPIALLSPDSKSLVLNSTNGPSIVNRTSRQVISSFGIPSVAVQYLRDGRLLLLSAGTNLSVFFWNGSERSEIPLLDLVRPQSLRFRGTMDGKVGFLGSFTGEASVWDLSSGRSKLKLQAHQKPIYCVEVSPDEQYFVTGSSDSTAKIWRASDGLLSGTISMNSTVEMLSFDAEGKRLAAASWDHTVGLWEVPSGKLLAKLQGHPSSVYFVSFSRDGGLISSAENGESILWDLRTFREMMRFKGAAQFVDQNTLLLGRESSEVMWEFDLLSAPSF
jgi:WD40 repeat protein